MKSIAFLMVILSAGISATAHATSRIGYMSGKVYINDEEVGDTTAAKLDEDLKLAGISARVTEDDVIVRKKGNITAYNGPTTQRMEITLGATSDLIGFEVGPWNLSDRSGNYQVILLGGITAHELGASIAELVQSASNSVSNRLQWGPIACEDDSLLKQYVCRVIRDL